MNSDRIKENRAVKAICLMSGGLDSILAARILLDQDITVLALTFTTPFFSAGKGEKAAFALEIPFRVEDITESYLEMMKSPRYGFGNNMNPCIDCHTLMVKKAGAIMENEGFDVIATGEVLGERPMSQNRQSLSNVARNSGYEDYVLRPLSAQLLSPSKPERDGLIDRDQLLAISGRSRKPQIALAQSYGITDYPQPAGGCLLTDPTYSFKLEELFRHTAQPDRFDLELLRIGRHFRLQSGFKIVVARNRSEGEQLTDMIRSQDRLITIEPLKGPIAVIPGGGDSNAVAFAVEFCVFYSKYRGQRIDVTIIKNDLQETRSSLSIEQSEVHKYLISPN